MPNALTRSNQVIKCRLCIKSWADALANLPSRARWFPQGDAAIRQRNGSCDSSALLGRTDGGISYFNGRACRTDRSGIFSGERRIPWVYLRLGLLRGRRYGSHVVLPDPHEGPGLA